VSGSFSKEICDIRLIPLEEIIKKLCEWVYLGDCGAGHVLMYYCVSLCMCARVHVHVCTCMYECVQNTLYYDRLH